jgi:hypothetical protein
MLLSRLFQIRLRQIPFYYILLLITVPSLQAVIFQQFLLVTLFYSRAVTLYFGQIPLYYILLFITVFFSSGRDPLVVLASRLFSRATSVLLPSVTNLSLRAAPYYNLAFQLLLAAIAILAIRIYPTSAKYLK